MLDPDLAAEELKSSGARMTAQRKAVIDILSGNRSHPTADCIISQVRERLGCVSSATIYNTLDELYELGIIRRIDGLEQRSHFDPDTSIHHHAVCLKCKCVWDVSPVCYPPDLPEGFEVNDILYQGFCARCADQ